MTPFQHTDDRGHTVTLSPSTETFTLTIRGRPSEALYWREITATLLRKEVWTLYDVVSEDQIAFGVSSFEGYLVSARPDIHQKKVIIQICDGLLDIELNLQALTRLGIRMAFWSRRRA